MIPGTIELAAVPYLLPVSGPDDHQNLAAIGLLLGLGDAWEPTNDPQKAKAPALVRQGSSNCCVSGNSTRFPSGRKPCSGLTFGQAFAKTLGRPLVLARPAVPGTC